MSQPPDITVLVNGKILLRDKRFVHFDEEQQREVVAEATRRAREVLARAGLTDRTYVPWRDCRDSDA